VGQRDADRMMMRPAIRVDLEEAGRTQEIAAVDILEETPIEESVVVNEGPRSEAPSISPLALDNMAPRRKAVDGRLGESTFRIWRQPRRRLGGIVLGAMGLSLAILAAAMTRPHGDDGQAASVVRVVAAAPSPGFVAATSTAMESAPPMASSGTIVSPGSAWPLFVDGKRITATSAIVACGKHTVRVGRSKLREVVVPCGATVTLDAYGSVAR
jgi:hypothetical protein